MIIKKPLTPEQIDAQSKPSEEAVRQAQDALFMYLIGRINELEAKLEPTVKSTRKKAT